MYRMQDDKRRRNPKSQGPCGVGDHSREATEWTTQSIRGVLRDSLR